MTRANQTDCTPYWDYERLGRLHGGATAWWRDGGNLNHVVRRESEPGEAARLIDVFADLPATCGVTSWSEGDSFTIEPLDLSGVSGAEEVVALSIDHVRTDVLDDTLHRPGRAAGRSPASDAAACAS